MKIELIHTPGCRKCDAAREALRAIAMQAAPDAAWIEVNALERLDYAVELGVLTLPALAIDGKLVFTSLPTQAQLASAVRQHARKVHDES